MLVGGTLAQARVRLQELLSDIVKRPEVAGPLATAKASGARMIDDAPRPGAHGTQVAFLHPKSFGGVLVELCGATEKH